MNEKFVQSGDWHIRKLDGSPLNLNSPEGAQYVLWLQERARQLEALTAKRSRGRRKAGPTETKRQDV